MKKALRLFLKKEAQQRERAIRGAWRAGYSYLDELQHIGHSIGIEQRKYIPTNEEDPPHIGDGEHRVTRYKLDSVSDDEILEVLNRK